MSGPELLSPREDLDSSFSVCHLPTVDNLLALGVLGLEASNEALSFVPAECRIQKSGKELRKIDLQVSGDQRLQGIAIGSDSSDWITLDRFGRLVIDAIVPEVWIDFETTGWKDLRLVTDRSWATLAISMQLSRILSR